MDEGGSVMGNMMGCEANCAMVGILEKGRANVKFIAHSHGGHASIPFRHNPFARLAKLINKVESHPPFKVKLTKPVKEMYKAMAPYMPFKYRFLLGNTWLLGPIMPYFMRKWEVSRQRWCLRLAYLQWLREVTEQMLFRKLQQLLQT